MKTNFIPTINNVDFHSDYAFTSLDFFQVDAGNRPSEDSDSTVKKYAKKMLNGEWFPELSPIYVGIRSKKIFNGEHRRKAYNIAKAKGYNGVMYVRFFDDNGNLEKKREALNGGKHWNVDDYVEAMISAGDADFAFLKKFALNSDHPQLHSAKGKPYYNKAAIVVGSTYKDFKDGYLSGSWNISRDSISKAEKTYAEMVRIKKILKYDDAGQDCWIYFGEAWNRIIKDKNYNARIKALPNGIEDFYDALRFIDNTNSNKTNIWFERFIKAIEKAESDCSIRD